MYNKSAFNKTLFGRIISEESGLFATISSEMSLVPSRIRATVNISNVTMAAVSAMVVTQIKLLMPLGAVTFGAESSVTARLSVHVRIPETIIAAISSMTAPSLRAAESTEISLAGINLAPGSTLIIDTDTLEIEVDGEPNVDCWVTGGTFFQFRAGENKLNFYDNATSRSLLVTVLWADRYL